MDNKEFKELSETSVKVLNGATSEEAREAWRAGYIFLKDQIQDIMENNFNDEAMYKLEEITEQQLDAFQL